MKSQVFQNKKINNEQQSEVKELLQENSTKTFNQLQYCKPYPSQSSIYYRAMIIFLHFTFFVNLLLVFKYLVTDNIFLGINKQILLFYVNSQNSIWFGVNSILKMLIISNIALQIILRNNKQKFKIIYSTTEKIKKILRIFIQIDFQLSSLLIITLYFSSIINLAFSIAIISFSLVFLQNYCDIKDRFQIGSFYYFMIFRLLLIFGSLSSILALFLGNSILFFMIYHLTASILAMIIYLFNGWIVYKDPLLRWSHFTFVSLYLSFAINFVVYYCCTPKTSSFAIHLILTFIVVQCSFYWVLKNRQIEIISPHSNVQQKFFVVSNVLQESYYQIEQKAFTSAVLKFHQFTYCNNLKCYSLVNEVYDSKKTKDYSSKGFIDERVSLTKFFLKCQFEAYLESHPKDDKALISYCQLLYWKFRNIGQTMYWLQHLRKNINYLSFGALIKFNGLIHLVQKDSRHFSELLYNKSLDIEHLIDAEEAFQSITSNINLILRERLQTWRLIQQQQIDLSLIRDKIQPTFANILQVSQDWKRISRYLKHSNKWKQQYLFFILYIKSEKIKNKVLEQFESTTEKNIDLRKFLKKGNNFELKSLFSQDTCCISVCLNDQKTFIKRVSNNFELFTQYSSTQMINANIDILLPRSSALYHQKIINQMHKIGKFSDQTIYKINQVYIVNKSGFLVPVYKIFKEFINYNGQLEYICFFKKAEIKQVIILCDQFFQIQNFTSNLIDELSFSKLDSQYMRNINLLSIIPKLTQKSIFLQNEGNLNNLARFTKQNIQSQELFVEMYIPLEEYFTSISSYYQTYLKQSNKNDLTSYLELIKSLQTQIIQNCVKLEINVTVNQIQNSQCKYYQVKLNQAQLKKQLKNYKNENTAIQKFKITSTTQQSKSPKDQITGKRKSKIVQLIFENIFIKEQANQVPHKNIYLQSLKYIWLLFLISLGIISNTKLIILSQKYSQLQQFSTKIGSILQISFLSSNIVAYYQSYLLNATTFSYVQPKITDSTNSLQIALTKNAFLQIIFEKKINTAAKYLPISKALQNENSSYNQIDFTFHLQSLFHSLAVESNLTIDTNNYKQLINYYYPSFINFTNNTKINLHDSFKTYIKQIQTQSIIVYSVQSLLFITIIISTIFTSLRFFQAMFEMMKIHCQFNPQDIKKIINYYKKTLHMFDNIQNKISPSQFENSNLSNIAGQIKQVNGQNNNLNKKSKDISLGKKQRNQSIAYIVKVTLCLMCLIGFNFWSNIYLNTLVRPIIDIQAYGYRQFMYSPSRIISSLIISNKYIYSYEFAPKDSYKQIMSSVFIQKSTPYIATPQSNTKFYTFIQNVYFNNLCQLFQTQMINNNFSISECQSIAESSFTRGIIAYSGFQYEKIKKIYSYNQDLTPQEIKEFYRSLQYSKLFLTNLVSIWQSQFLQLCEWTLLVIRIILIVSNVIILLVMILGFISLFNYLEKQYKFYKQFYRNMMPQYIISEQKIIKSKLTVISFL